MPSRPDSRNSYVWVLRGLDGVSLNVMSGNARAGGEVLGGSLFLFASAMMRMVFDERGKKMEAKVKLRLSMYRLG